MMGNTVCALADAAAMPVQSFLTKFRAEFDAHLQHGGCPQRAARAAAPVAAHA
jgi:NADH-quinone oxidoreductase subunit F